MTDREKGGGMWHNVLATRYLLNLRILASLIKKSLKREKEHSEKGGARVCVDN